MKAAPPLEQREPSTAFSDTDATRLGRSITPRVAAHPGRSGIFALRDARDAFAARALLAQAAERSLDVQYYIWRRDITGTLLFEALRAAADRGVRVRLLLDDNNTSGLDATLAALDAHPNIEVRLFNPFFVRKPRVLGYLTDFRRLNRRMHNKSFTADNQATVIGGRNVGDEYFGATHDVLFADLDVIAVGPVVKEVSNAFDRYWASGSSYAAGQVLPPVRPDRIAGVSAAAQRITQSSEAVAYTRAVRESSFVHDLLQGTLELEWAPTRMVSDDPAKGLGLAAPEALLIHDLKRALGEPLSDFALVSPYFVPTAAGLAWFQALANRGVKVQVLTNALEATDVALVHAGYAKWRRSLLKAGIRLFELRRTTPDSGPTRPAGSMGSSGSSLHAKTASIDRSRVFIGSFNFDPRSAKLNTEMGFLIESSALAGQMGALFRDRIPMDAYEVRLSDDGRVSWEERRGSEVSRHDREPGTTAGKRAWVRLLSALPIEWLL
jgi:putative cardiolipin synthase